MNNSDKQIINLAKDGFSPEEIASALGYDLAVVSTILMQNDRLLDTIPLVTKSIIVDSRDANVKEKTFNEKVEALQDLALQTIEGVMRCSDNDGVRLKAGLWVAEHACGMKKPKESAVTINVVEINKQLRNARERIAMVSNVSNISNVRSSSRELEMAS